MNQLLSYPRCFSLESLRASLADAQSSAEAAAAEHEREVAQLHQSIDSQKVEWEGKLKVVQEQLQHALAEKQELTMQLQDKTDGIIFKFSLDQSRALCCLGLTHAIEFQFHVSIISFSSELAHALSSAASHAAQSSSSPSACASSAEIEALKKQHHESAQRLQQQMRHHVAQLEANHKQQVETLTQQLQQEKITVC